MSETSSHANNKAVAYRGRAEREMPMQSKAQNAAMHAAADGKSTIGVPKSVGEKFVSDSAGQKIKPLPKRVRKLGKKLRGRGMISDKAAQKMGME